MLTLANKVTDALEKPSVLIEFVGTFAELSMLPTEPNVLFTEPIERFTLTPVSYTKVSMLSIRPSVLSVKNSVFIPLSHHYSNFNLPACTLGTCNCFR